jgi:tRNA-specific 2-thiouridylase
MKALVLFSGGLDSTIALKLLKDQGLETYAIYVETGFVNADYDQLKDLAENQIGAKLILLMRQQQYVEKVLFSPKYGYGRFLNPCLDCHKFMIEQAWEWGIERFGKGNFFLATGEVLGQRGKSQTRFNIDRMNKDLGEIVDYLVRPLSIRYFPKTIPEKLGVIDPDKLLNIKGKQRKRQLELIEILGISNYSTPSGGCLLTTRGFSEKLRRFNKYYEYQPADFYLIKHGRHFWFDDKLLIISRNEKETKAFSKYKDPRNRFILIDLPKDVVGPVGLLDAKADDDLIRTACGLLLAYAKADPEKQYTFTVNNKFYEGIKALDREQFVDKLIKG